MLSTIAALSPLFNLSRSLGTTGTEEYGRLLRLLRAARHRFVLLPVESDFRPALRDALLERLRNDLKAADCDLAVVRLSEEEWDLKTILEREPAAGPGVVALVGLEQAPGIVPEAGAPSLRPPAIAMLNVARETLRKRLPGPLLVWCDPITYTALQEHAPDFFDHYTALFTFLDAAPKPVDPQPSRAIEMGELTRIIERRRIASKAALTFYEEQVTRLEQPTPERARALLGLAEAIRALDDTNLISRLRRAEHLVREALGLLSPEMDGTEWARGHLDLGTLLNEMPTGKQDQNRRQAIQVFQAALRVYTEADFPREWAATQNNLAVAYRNLPTGDRAENLQKAIAGYQAALRVYTEADFPIDWAMTQNNLSNAYSYLPTGDRAENLQKAIAGYQAALRVYTEADFPREWATIQNNLAVAYRNLPERDRVENLQRAIAGFQAALRVYTEADFPIEWAGTQKNYGLALWARGMETGGAEWLEAAAECFAAAERGYLAAGMEPDADGAREMREQVEAELARVSGGEPTRDLQTTG